MSQVIDSACSARNIRLLTAILVAAVLLVYANSLFNGFVWDDNQIIVNNPVNRDFGNLRQLLFGADVVYADDVADYYRPLNRLTYMVEYRLYGLNPVGYHLVNVLIHAANVVLLFMLGRRLFGETLPAWAAALIFAVHPLNTEAINFISGRNNALATLFVLATVLLYQRGCEKNSRHLFILAGAAMFCGALCKEIALMVLPFLLLAPVAGDKPTRLNLRQRLLTLLPCAAGAALYLGLRTAALSAAVVPAGVHAGLWQRLSINIYAVPKYLSLVLFPAALQNYHFVPADFREQWSLLLPAWLAVAFVTVLVLKIRTAPLLFAALWLLVNYIPISHVVPITSAPIAERYFYLPGIGIWLLFGCLVQWAATRLPVQRGAFVAVAALALLLALITWQRNSDWQSDFTLFSSLVRVDPASVPGHYNLGGVYREQGNLLQAEQEWLKTIEIEPGHAKALNQLGSVALTMDRLAEAASYYSQALQRDPANAESHYNLALVLVRLQRNTEALGHLEQFLKHVPPEYRQLIPEVEARIAELRRQR
jgi:protein O-mannosyl-transferase